MGAFKGFLNNDEVCDLEQQRGRGWGGARRVAVTAPAEARWCREIPLPRSRGRRTRASGKAVAADGEAWPGFLIGDPVFPAAVKPF